MTLIDKEELLRLRQKQIRDYNPNLRALVEIKLALDDALTNAKLQPHDKNVLVNLLNHRLTTLYKGAKYDGLIAGATAVPTELRMTTPIAPASTPMAPTVPIPQPVEAVAAEPEVQLLPDVPVEPHAIQAVVEAPIQHEPVTQGRSSVEQPRSFVIPTADELKIHYTYKNKFDKISEEIAKYPHKINMASTGEIVLNGNVIQNSSFKDLIRGLYIRKKGSNIHGEEAFVKVLNEINISPELISHRVPKGILTSLVTPTLKGNESPEEFSSFVDEPPEQEEEQEGEGKRSKSKKHSLKIHPPPGKRPRILWLYR